jgi:hypothetical protein
MSAEPETPDRWRVGDVDTTGRVVLDVDPEGTPTRWYDPSQDGPPMFGMVLSYGTPAWAWSQWCNAKRWRPE